MRGFASNDQKVNFSLTDGNNLPFQIKKIIDEIENTTDDAEDNLDDPTVQYDRAEIIVRPGVQRCQESTYEFDLSANELGNAAENSVAIDVRIVIAVDNTAPSFATAQLAEATVAERAGDVVIAQHSARQTRTTRR